MHGKSVRAHPHGLSGDEGRDGIAHERGAVAGERGFRQGAIAQPEATAMIMKRRRAAAASAGVPDETFGGVQAEAGFGEKPRGMPDGGLAVGWQTDERPARSIVGG